MSGPTLEARSCLDVMVVCAGVCACICVCVCVPHDLTDFIDTHCEADAKSGIDVRSVSRSRCRARRTAECGVGRNRGKQIGT